MLEAPVVTVRKPLGINEVPDVTSSENITFRDISEELIPGTLIRHCHFTETANADSNVTQLASTVPPT